MADLVASFNQLPGIGQKSAQRLAFHLLSMPQDNVAKMSHVMLDTRQRIRYCQTCFNISFDERCYICVDPSRDESLLCVVSEPKDIMAVERTGDYKGRYHVLGGLISPLDGIHPEVLRIKELGSRLQYGQFSEIILAINPTIEGDATSLYLMKYLAPFEVKVSKLAYGLPMGGDIEYADEMTLQRAFRDRSEV